MSDPRAYRKLYDNRTIFPTATDSNQNLYWKELPTQDLDKAKTMLSPGYIYLAQHPTTKRIFMGSSVGQAAMQ